MAAAMTASRHDRPQPQATGTAVANAAKGIATNSASATWSHVFFVSGSLVAISRQLSARTADTA